jgi:hypothetical protein
MHAFRETRSTLGNDNKLPTRRLADLNDVCKQQQELQDQQAKGYGVGRWGHTYTRTQKATAAVSCYPAYVIRQDYMNEYLSEGESDSNNL